MWLATLLAAKDNIFTRHPRPAHLLFSAILASFLFSQHLRCLLDTAAA
jgi:hypothetical protein